MQNTAVNPTPVSDSESDSQVWKASDYSDYTFDVKANTQKEAPQTSLEEPNANAVTMIPTLPLGDSEALDDEDILYNLRHFHLGDPSTNAKTEMVGNDFVPALLHAYRDVSKVRYSYPLLLTPVENAEASATELTQHVSKILLKLVESFAPNAEDARILKDNLPRFEIELRKKTSDEEEGPSAAIPQLEKAWQNLQEKLGLNEQDNARFQADFERLLANIPPDTQLLKYGRYAAIHLLNHAIRSRIIPRRKLFRQKVQDYIQDLQELLNVDWLKSDESLAPQVVSDSIGNASSKFETTTLSKFMDHYSRGTVVMTHERRERIESVLQILEEYLQQDDPIIIKMVHLGGLTGAWLQNTPGFEEITDADPTATATQLFDQQTKKIAKVFAATRIAQLEIDGIYDTLVHGPWFANFTWEAFSKEEVLLLPAIIALESADRIADQAMSSLSRLLSSGRPVHTLIRVQSYNDPHALPNEDPFFNYRLELGYLGLSHRQAVISQSSAARPQHLLERFLLALETTHTSSLHIINTGVQHTIHGINAWLMAGAALESRAHPFFYIDPEAGDFYADRMDFTGNPQPDIDWPSHSFLYKDASSGEIVTKELAFTFADYVLLVPTLHKHFRLVPAGFEGEKLVPVDVYLANQPEKICCERVPFIWAVNGQGELRKLVISRALIFACQDRLNFWHILQEFAGIRNKYVDIALEKARDEIRTEEEVERKNLQAEYEEELEQVRSKTASEAMQHLTDVLLGMDLTAPVRARSATTPATPQVVEEVVEEEVAAEEPEEKIVFEDPWIDSELCTSCNDCLNINTVLFVYNESKQAVFGDLNSGTYAQLVEGAEICPAKCIHPGKPRNPSEPGLEELIKRAEPFNTM